MSGRAPTTTVWGEHALLIWAAAAATLLVLTSLLLAPLLPAVGNIPFDTTEAEVHGMLSSIGTIKNFR